MYFTEEEKEIIKNIAKKGKYTINDFFIDNWGEAREKINRKFSWSPTNGWNNFMKVNGTRIYETWKFNEEYRMELDRFIFIWIVLEKLNFVKRKFINMEKVCMNFQNFGRKNPGEFVDEETCRDYEDFLLEELIVLRERLQDFIIDGFKTKEEIEQEKEIQARNQALADSRKSVRLSEKSFNATKIVAILSTTFTVISLIYTIFGYNKETEVKVKNLNEINTQQLVSQLERTNQELKDIKTKFEELQKQTQNSPKN